MIKRIIFLACAGLLVCGLAFADSSILSGDNAVILGNESGYGPEGKTPPTTVIKVYVTNHGTLGASTQGRAANSAGGTRVADVGIEVGDVMVWERGVSSGYGYCVRPCSFDLGVARSTNDFGVGSLPSFAGVMVTNCSRDTGNLTTPSGSGSNVGYMAIHGFCQAKIDTSECLAGEQLILNGETLESSFATTKPQTRTRVSQDIGVLLNHPAADTLAHIWLR